MEIDLVGLAFYLLIAVMTVGFIFLMIAPFYQTLKLLTQICLWIWEKVERD